MAGIWSPTTLKSEKARLNALGPACPLLTEEDINALYKRLKASGLRPYTLKTLFIRLVSMELWAVEHGLYNGKMKFKAWMRQYGRAAFRNAYQKEVLPDELTFASVVSRIENEIKDPTIRARCLQLLFGGMRISESRSLHQGRVLGKGRKLRKVHLPPGLRENLTASSKSDSTLRRHLSKLGLKPHTLRKLAATRLARTQEFDAFELCALFGWSSVNTALQYIQDAKNSDTINKLESAFGVSYT